ncbi:GGDEF domain-containing protein [Alicyclobacillus acidocaldarius]|nr:GGDEF domain-containing protein [Alicyclobacillus acidocaldarius]
MVAARTEPVVHITWETSHALMEACSAQVSLGLDMIMALRVAEHASQRDLLTGAWNRLGIERRWPYVLEVAREDRARHAIVGIVDIDHFKHINDTYGHPVGDRVLRLVVQTLKEEARPDELVGRIGGDEFLVVAWSDSPDWRPRMFALQRAVRERWSGTCAVSVGGACSAWMATASKPVTRPRTSACTRTNAGESNTEKAPFREPSSPFFALIS